MVHFILAFHQPKIRSIMRLISTFHRQYTAKHHLHKSNIEVLILFPHGGCSHGGRSVLVQFVVMVAATSWVKFRSIIFCHVGSAKKIRFLSALSAASRTLKTTAAHMTAEEFLFEADVEASGFSEALFEEVLPRKNGEEG